MSKLNNNIYGILGIGAINSNWCADFDGNPKTDGNGNIKGSPYALQFCIKKSWNNKGEKVLGIKEVNEEGFVLTQPKKYESLFDQTIDKNTTEKDILNNLLQCKDVINFGCVFTGLGSINLQGVVQIADGMNAYCDTVVNTETILSPYASAEKKTMSTNGIKITTNEAHYLYPFTIMPSEYKKLENEQFKGYEKEDYEDFKKTSLNAVSLYNSKTKVGCTNEFGLFVKVKEEYNYILALGDLSEYVNVYRKDNQVIYDLTRLENLLNDCSEKIEDIEIYHKSKTNIIKGFENSILNVKKFNIITGKEL